MTMNLWNQFRFHQMWKFFNLKPLLVSQKLTGFHFTTGNPILIVDPGTFENCWQQPSAILRRVWFSQMSQNHPTMMKKLAKCAQSDLVKDVVWTLNVVKTHPFFVWKITGRKPVKFFFVRGFKSCLVQKLFSQQMMNINECALNSKAIIRPVEISSWISKLKKTVQYRGREAFWWKNKMFIKKLNTLLYVRNNRWRKMLNKKTVYKLLYIAVIWHKNHQSGISRETAHIFFILWPGFHWLVRKFLMVFTTIWTWKTWKP